MKKRKIRYAVVGLGHIAQVAVLPAFRNASTNSELTALVSQDRKKLKILTRKYKAEGYSYEQYDELLRSGKIDAVYIALPNNLHCDYTIRAAEAGIHVLCEKPLAVTEKECRQMIDAARTHRVKLMTAYRLHFEETNLTAVKIANSGKLGDLRYFNSLFAMQVKRDNIRTDKELGGGTLYDIGVYCINAARMIFKSEPYEVFAYKASGNDERFREIEEMVSAVLRFPGERLASFTVSFGSQDLSVYSITGTKGSLRVDPAYEYIGELKHHLTLGDRPEKTKVFKPRDQFAPELIYFSNCILRNKEPEPSGTEGLADVRIVEALYRSAETGEPLKVEGVSKMKRAETRQVITKSAVSKPEIIHAESASGGP
jgi:predicted dehydrogenase